VVEGAETMGRRLQRIREAKGFSQSQLARAAGIPPASLRNWEQDRRGLSLEAAARLAVALEVSLDELAGVRAKPTKRKGKDE
jgi:transcriptional regulator with XRE-family HTH domain